MLALFRRFRLRPKWRASWIQPVVLELSCWYGNPDEMFLWRACFILALSGTSTSDARIVSNRCRLSCGVYKAQSSKSAISAYSLTQLRILSPPTSLRRNGTEKFCHRRVCHCRESHGKRIALGRVRICHDKSSSFS